ncbi:sigma-54-dependent transcriptional regulator [Klebsiella pneumoniae]|uniref:sigma-54-dependent transcriptional regulator n=1 Tax=Klebsiella pneumoniae TaxID=573 RepID=UPI002381744C|nr:sigma-54 dependent transcriptional regulator [Klebsiella pneumoniae]MDE4740299.1 sigma-54 dependent transcriptional regulator [Klebsiella pneumoniae]MDE4766077.1 sigma-54 dependent transcriptional regulator [Klebsiella pneumoniae]MDE4792290.1 sigma-54 dependent transcriptional regulator [Klebsiella pneumoniae]
MTDIDVLIIEDDIDIRIGCIQALKLEKLHAVGAPSVEDARYFLPTMQHHGVIVTDMKLPGMCGFTFQKQLNVEAPDIPIIIITGQGDIETAVQAMHNGAYDFLTKPFSPQQLINTVTRALSTRKLVNENNQLRRKLASVNSLENKILGNSVAINRVKEKIKDVAMTPANILVYGETGTGKELVAKCIHNLSGRTGPFVAFNCGAFPESLFDIEIFGYNTGAFPGASDNHIGKIEYADKGTLFLDEIESLPLMMQVKLLRVLQERTFSRLGSNESIPVDIRIIAAGKKRLSELVQTGHFRADLHFRLSVINIEIPALRDRIEDIPLLFEFFVNQASLSFQRPAPEIKRHYLHKLMCEKWPGNVRELRNQAERFVLGIQDVVFNESNELSLVQMVESFERSIILNELNHNNGNLSKAADALRVAKSTLFDKIKKYSLNY